MSHLILSCSLSPKSHSALLAGLLKESLESKGAPTQLIDLRELPLPFCDAGACYGDPNVHKLKEAFSGATSVTIATPIYNFETGGATRNLLALTGRDAWQDKLVGFVAAAGGQGSYMSIMPLASSLMLDFRCLIIPRFVYATGASFTEGKLTDPKVEERIAELESELRRLSACLASSSP